jgi:LPXTG-site transpeptidase (sortase) family protein
MRIRPKIRRALIPLAVVGLLALIASGPAATAQPPSPRLVIPRLQLDDPLGTSLDAGPAFYAGSGRPGEPYTIAIAGHRTTHTRPFWSLDLLGKGDRIVIVWNGKQHVYLVTGSRVVTPANWSIAKEQGRERLILTTCTPRFSARERLVVFANAVVE